MASTASVMLDAICARVAASAHPAPAPASTPHPSTKEAPARSAPECRACGSPTRGGPLCDYCVTTLRVTEDGIGYGGAYAHREGRDVSALSNLPVGRIVPLNGNAGSDAPLAAFDGMPRIRPRDAAAADIACVIGIRGFDASPCVAYPHRHGTTGLAVQDRWEFVARGVHIQASFDRILDALENECVRCVALGPDLAPVTPAHPRLCALTRRR